jgi:hypothetical protein
MYMAKRTRQLLAVLLGLSLVLVPAMAFASNQPSLTQTINAGTLTADIYQSDDTTPVASPAVAFAAQNYSFSCKTSTATFGDTNDKVNVTNLANGINTWTLAIAATGGFATTWSDGASHSYKFNDATASGCTNGQMTVDPSAAILTDDCSGACSDTTVTKGSSTAFNHGGSVDSVTLLSDSAGTAWEGYLIGIGLSQKIPALQHSGSYTLPMTVTVTNT